MITVLIIAAIWIACGVLVAGFWLAHFQHSYPTIARESFARDRRHAWAFGMSAGPIGLFVQLIEGDFGDGLMYRNPHKQ